MQVCISSSFLFLHIDIYRDAIYNRTKKKANFFTLNYRKPIYNESKYKKGAITMKVNKKYGLRKYRNVNSQIDLRKGYVRI